MKSITTTRNFSNSNSQDSIVVYLPTSNYSPSIREDEKNSDCCESVLIYKDFDIENEKCQVKGDNDDDLFRLLSMNFYSSREKKPKPFDHELTLKSARSNRETALAGKTNSLVSIKPKNKSRKTLHLNFFDSEKIKKKPLLLSPKRIKEEDLVVGSKKKGKKCKISYIESLKTDMDLPYNSVGSNKMQRSIDNLVSPLKKGKPIGKYYSPFLNGKESSRRDMSSNVSKIVSSDTRYSSLTKPKKEVKNSNGTILKRRKSPVLKKVKKNKKIESCENGSVSPRLKEEKRESDDSLGFKKFPLTLKDQLFNTFSEGMPKDKKMFNLTLPVRNESSTASATSFGGKSSLLNTLESKRTTREQISSLLGGKEANTKKEGLSSRTKGSRQSQNSESSKASSSSKRLVFQKVSEELSKRKGESNRHGEHKGPYLFFDMPIVNIQSNPTVKGVKEIKEKEKEKKKIVGKKTTMRGTEVEDKGKKKESHETGNLTVKTKENEYANYRDSFVTMRF